MIGGGPFRLKAGEWTDDTSMALCLGESLVECGGFEPVDQMQRYLRWWQDGYLSSTGRCFDVGIAVAAALGKYQNTGHPFAGSTDPRSAGNGSLTRLAPVVLAYRATPEQVIYYAVESSRTTHGAQTCLDACKLYAAMILAALDGASKGEILSPGLYQGSLVPEVAEISAGSYKVKNPPAIVGSGYVVRSLEAALWAFYRSSSFERGALLAANLGNDADTTCAIYGQLAGAFYSASAIPEKWLATWRNATLSPGWQISCSHSLKASLPLPPNDRPRNIRSGHVRRRHDFQAVTELLERQNEPWCLIGGLAINAYCEPIDTRTPVDDNDYQVPFHFTGEVAKLNFKLGPEQITEEGPQGYA